MRKGYLRKLLAYMKKVFKIEDKLGKLREDSKYNAHMINLLKTIRD